MKLQLTWKVSLDFIRFLLQQTQKIKTIALMVTRMIRRVAQTNSPTHSAKVGPPGGHTEHTSPEDSAMCKEACSISQHKSLDTEPHKELKHGQSAADTLSNQ